MAGVDSDGEGTTIGGRGHGPTLASLGAASDYFPPPRRRRAASLHWAAMPPRPVTWIGFALLLAASVVLLLLLAYPLRQPLFLAAVLAAALARWNEWLVGRLRGRRTLAAGLVTAGVVLLLLLPVSGIIAFAIQEAVLGARFVRETLQAGGLPHLFEVLPSSLRPWVERGVALFPEGLDQLSSQISGGSIASLVSGAVSTTSSVAVNGVLMLIAFYVLLVDGPRLVGWLAEIAPLRGGQTIELLREFARVSRSVLGSTVATAAVQAIAATVGYLIARVPHAFFFGLLTFFAAFIPAVGTAVVVLPLCLLVYLLGHPIAAIFLTVWGLGVVSMIDTFLKPLLIKDGARMPGAVIFFSLFGGILVFGPLGLLAGPLTVTFFLAMVRLGQRDFAAPVGGDGTA